LSEITKLVILECCVLKLVIYDKFLHCVLSWKLKLNGGIMTVMNSLSFLKYQYWDWFSDLCNNETGNYSHCPL